jgi:DNA-binding FadR family transcriptional regulator
MPRKSVSSPIVRQVAKALRTEALNREEGELIGSEEELLARFGVSRPTLRQAAGLLTLEQLLIVKRGVGGGYIATRPSADAVTHVTAIYLQTRDTSMEEIINSSKPITIEMARLAAHSQNKDAIEELRQFVETERAAEEEQAGETKEPFSKADYREFLKTEREFGRILGNLSGNRVLTLFLDVVYDFCAGLRGEGDVFINRPERITLHRHQRLKLAEAILERDEELVIIAARRRSATIIEWFMEDLARHEGQDRLANFTSWQSADEDEEETQEQPIGRARAAQERAASRKRAAS